MRLTRRDLLLASSALLMAGCTVPDQGAAGSGSGSTDTELVLWYESGLPIASAMPSLIAAYNAAKPKYPVRAEPQPDLSIKLSVVIGAHDAPDVILYQRSKAFPLISHGAGTPFGQLAQRDGVDGKQFTPIAWQAAQYGGNLWGLPLTMDATVLLTNTALIADAKVSPSATWTTSAFDAACAAMVKHDAQGHVTQTGVIFDQGTPFEVWLWQQGADLLSADGKTPTFAGAEGLKALQWLLADQKANGGLQELTRLVSSVSLTGGVPAVFTHGKIGMLSGTYAYYNNVVGQQLDFKVGLVPLPTLDGGTPATLFDGIYGFMPINGANPRPEGSWEFIHWLATDPTVQAKFFSLGSIPAFAAAQHDSSIANNAAVQLMLNVLTTARVEQPIPYIEQVSTQANAAALDVLNGQGDPATALAKAKQQVDQTIQMETSI